MTADPNLTDTKPPQLSLIALFLKFLRFGALAFGGPVAQIAMLRQALVEEERWIDSARFNRLLAVLQVLPGPEAHELCVHLGMIARGRIGGLLAGIGFMLPGLVLMLAAGWLYVTWIAGDAGLTGVLLGVQIVVLAIILRAVVRIGQHVIEDRWLGVIAAASLIATLIGVPFWIPLAAGGLAYAASRPALIAIVLALAAVTAWLLVPGVVTESGMPQMAPAPVTLAALFIAGLKGGLLTFGGAYTAIPYVRADTVGRGWIGDSTFLDGVALAGVLPAPLVIFATFTGYVAGGPAGALAITAGMFLPAFAFSLIFFERLEAIVGNPALHRLLAGVAAAVVGIIAATLVQLVQATGVRITNPLIAAILFGVALVVVWRVKGAWVTPAIVAGGALAGWLVAP
ncbi:chromate efflux transporter [Sphingomonas sp. AOB5]|uniref:chromate efflux transporter n=1 Tax=Sphingomonas sp. AOB5 TaxID=3034017 RepID=UPI0023F98A01|nr:chromate efflux transporter [Sphingomonas sp. AOB5]MDF7774219.1 chromate efflux transporter [Sphingomonas sp. AOB5]